MKITCELDKPTKQYDELFDWAVAFSDDSGIVAIARTQHWAREIADGLTKHCASIGTGKFKILKILDINK